MIPRNQQNRKARIDLTCPICGMELSKGWASGFIRDGETYCCRGCAEGTGCTCFKPALARKKGFNRPGSLGQRNAENSPRDRNWNEEVDTSGHPIGKRKRATKIEQTRRGERLISGEKIARAQSKERVSTREQARGRSELPAALPKRRSALSERVPGIPRTGAKNA